MMTRKRPSREKEMKAGTEVLTNETLAFASAILCAIVLYLLCNPKIVYPNVAANSVAEIRLWFLIHSTTPLILWSAYFTGYALVLFRTFRYERATVQMLALLGLCSIYIFGVSQFIATTTWYQFTIASLEMNVALIGAFLAFVLPCIFLFIWKVFLEEPIHLEDC